MSRVSAITPEDAHGIMHVLDNVRAADEYEIGTCTDGGVFPNRQLYAYASMSKDRHRYLIRGDDGEPIGLFGVVEDDTPMPTAWAFGTDRFPEGMRVMTKHIRDVIVPELYERGVPEVTCFSLSTRSDSAKLITAIGGKVHAVLSGVGSRNHDDVIQWLWTNGHSGAA